MKKLKAAKGKVVLTQPSGNMVTGIKKPDDKSKTAHPELNCNILILNDNHTKLCLLGLNPSLTEFTLLNNIINKIEIATDIRAGNIIIWSHGTISAPNAAKQMYPGIEGIITKAYSEGLANKIVEEVKKTDERYKEVVLKTGKTTLTDLKGTNGYADKELITLSIWGNNNKLFSLLVNFNCQLSIFESKEEAQRVLKEIGTHIEDCIISSPAIEGKIRTVSERITLPLPEFSKYDMILQGMAIHNFALITIPGEVNIESEKKIKELSSYKNTMIITYTCKKMEPDESVIITNLVKEKILDNLLRQSVKVMERKASDNKYLHKDFHISMNLLMKYIYDNFGEEALIKYLKQYSRAYYKPLNQKLRTGDKEALVNYFKDIYEKEEWPVNIISGEDSVEITQDACPAISHIIQKGGKPCPYYQETYNTVYETICENTPFEYNLVYFNEETGACKQLFILKEVKQ